MRVMSSDTGAARPRRRRRIPFRYWVIIVLAALAAIFIAQNTGRHRVNLLWVSVESRTWLMLTVIFVAGVLVGLLLRRRRR